MSYEVEIAKALAKIGKNGTANPDAKHNQGRLIGEAFLWDRIAKYAEAKSDAAWAAMLKEEVIPEKSTITPGDHELAYSPSFTVIAKATQPVKRFDANEFATMLAKSKYKVPVSTTKEMLDAARVPTKPIVSMKIVERG